MIVFSGIEFITHFRQAIDLLNLSPLNTTINPRDTIWFRFTTSSDTGLTSANGLKASLKAS